MYGLNIQELQAYVTLIKDIITALAALTAGIIAVLGLQTWKKQLKGKTEYELARRLLGAVYKLREAIRFVRTPFMSVGEISQALEEANIKLDQPDPNSGAIQERAVYQKRWEKIQQALEELDLEAFEAEVVWGYQVAEKLKPLQNCIRTLFASIQTHLRQLQPTYRDSFDVKVIEKIDQVICITSEDPSNDPFAAEIAEAIGEIENFLRPRLKL
jgi:hypothetical protein